MTHGFRPESGDLNVSTRLRREPDEEQECLPASLTASER